MGQPQSAARQPKQEAGKQFSTDLGEFFGSIPGMKEIFSKGPLNQGKATAADDDDDSTCHLIGALSTCGKTFERASVMLEVVRDLAAGPVTAQDKRRIFFLCEEMQNLFQDGQQAIDQAYTE